MLLEFCQKKAKKVEINHLWKGTKNIANVFVDGKLIANGCSEHKETAKLIAAKEALGKLLQSEASDMETEEGGGVVNSVMEIEGAKNKLNELCSRKRWRPALYRYELPFIAKLSFVLYNRDKKESDFRYNNDILLKICYLIIYF